MASVLAGLYLATNAKNELQAQLTVAQHRLSQAIQYARNQALVQHSALVLQPVQLENWARGMMLFKDNANHRLSHRDELVYAWHGFRSPLTITWVGFQSSDYLIFSQTPGHGAVNGHFSIAYQGVEIGRVVINRLGRLRFANFTAK